MKILIVHNEYQQRGGEDAVREAEANLLRDAGHEVNEFLRHNDEISGLSFIQNASLGWNTVWSAVSYRELLSLLLRQTPDIVHFHNTFPLISPSAYYACEEAGIPVAQSLHNYRLLCPSATLLRDGKVCEACLRQPVAWPGVLHGCYRRSRPATLAVTAMLAAHRVLRTWQERVHVYIALSEFARRKFIEGGLPEDHIVVKPNFVAGDFKPKTASGEYALFVGRLSEEKGPQFLVSAWRMMQARVPLRVVGNGPLLEKLARGVRDNSLAQIELTGRRTPEEVRLVMHGARFLVFPSIWYEGFPITIAEAFACGLPVIASRLGSMPEIVRDGSTGLLFKTGDADDLAAKAQWAWTHPAEMESMGRTARHEFETKYSASVALQNLEKAYELALKRHAESGRSRQPLTENKSLPPPNRMHEAD